MGKDLSIEERVRRDENNARSAKELAARTLKNYSRTPETTDITRGPSKAYQEYLNRDDKRLSALHAISAHPFHAMVELEVETVDRSGRRHRRSGVVWYTNEHSAHNEVFEGDDGQIPVLSWTHPGIQLGLICEIGESEDVTAQGLTLRKVTPLARAKFSQVLPSISGLYEPGGRVRPEEVKEPAKGLKAVKLDMTSDQVHAFISKMDGMMMVSGAPGSGKTTVAFQRVRFLYDQHGERRDAFADLTYSPEFTRIFLANENLINYSRKLLVDDLQIPENVVSLVPEFIRQYLSDRWLYKHEARLRPRVISHIEQRAREAFFGLCKAEDLFGCWKQYEKQIAKRLSEADD